MIVKPAHTARTAFCVALGWKNCIATKSVQYIFFCTFDKMSFYLPLARKTLVFPPCKLCQISRKFATDQFRTFPVYTKSTKLHSTRNYLLLHHPVPHRNNWFQIKRHSCSHDVICKTFFFSMPSRWYYMCSGGPHKLSECRWEKKKKKTILKKKKKKRCLDAWRPKVGHVLARRALTLLTLGTPDLLSVFDFSVRVLLLVWDEIRRFILF